MVQLQNMKDVTEDVGLGRNGTRVKSQCPKDEYKKTKGKSRKKMKKMMLVKVIVLQPV